MTLNQLVKSLRALALSHQQIKSFDFRPASEDQLETTSFPHMLVEIQPSTAADMDLLLKFSFILSDRTQKDRGNVIEILSDTLSTIMDYRALLFGAARGGDFVLDINQVMTPFEGATDEETAGWMMEATIKLTDLKDTCQIPQ